MNTPLSAFACLESRPERILVQTGDPSVRQGLIAMLPALQRYAWSLTRHRQNSEDLVQDAMVRMLAAEQRFQPGTDLRRWSFTVLRNLFISGVRSKRGRLISLDDADFDVGCTPAVQSDGLELAELQHQFALLPQASREALNLAADGEERYDEFARRTRCAVGTIKSRVHRARVRFGRQLAAAYG